MESTWETRDLPVLEAIVELADQGGSSLRKPAIAQRTGFDVETVKMALFALAAEQPPLFDYSDTSTWGARDIDLIRHPTGHARRTVGAWPTPESWADRMTQALRDAADQEPDPEKKSRFRQAADVLGGIGREIIIRTATGTISGAL